MNAAKFWNGKRYVDKSFGSRRPRLESLESRSLLAADVLAAFEVEALNLDAQPVSQVEVGEEFLLRVSAIDKRSSDPRPMFAAFTDLTYDANLVSRSSEPQFSSLFPNVIRSDVAIDGNWDEIGAVLDVSEVENSDSQILFEIKMRAESEGSIVFATNPAEDLPVHDVLLLDVDTAISQSQVSYGFTRLRIGAGEASEWQNPGNPADVNADGVVDGIDRDTLNGLLSNDTPIELANSSIAASVAPFVDVDGDHLLSSADVDLVVAQLPNQGSGTPSEPTPPPRESSPLPQFPENIGIEILNVRTGEMNPGEVLLGDVLEYQFVSESETANARDFAFFSMLSEVEYDSGLIEELAATTVESDDGFPTFTYRIQAVETGTASLSVRLDERFLGLVFADSIRERLDEVEAQLAELSREIIILQNDNRPSAVGDAYSFDELGLESARETYGHLSATERPTLSVQAEAGILANDDVSVDSATVLLIQPPRNGTLDLEDDGAFSYVSRENVGVGDEFGYVLITDQGVSDPQYVRIDESNLPLIDIEIFASDAAGNAIEEIRVGESFFVEVSVFSAAAIGTSRFNELQLDLEFNENVVAQTPYRELSSAFPRQFYSIETNPDGTLRIDSQVRRPALEIRDGVARADFSGFSAEKIVGRAETLFRFEVEAIAEGSLNLSEAAISIQYSPNGAMWVDGLPATSAVPRTALNVSTANVQVVSSPWQNRANPLDATADGIVSAIDVLVTVNRINQYGSELPANRTDLMGEGESAMNVQNYYYDANGDGFLSAIDVLSRVNHLNQVMAEGEPEDDEAPETLYFVPDTSLGFDWIEERRRRRAR